MTEAAEMAGILPHSGASSGTRFLRGCASRESCRRLVMHYLTDFNPLVSLKGEDTKKELMRGDPDCVAR